MVCVLGALEVSLRGLGFVPSVVDDWDLWCLQRDRANRGGRRAIALIGSSRMLWAVDPLQLEHEFPGSVVAQLALGGRSPLGILEDLAGDDTFDGVVLCELVPYWLEPVTSAQTREIVHYYREAWSFRLKTEKLLRSFLEDRCVIVRCLPWTDVRDFLRKAQLLVLRRRCEIGGPGPMRVHSNRRTEYDFRMVDVAKARRSAVDLAFGEGNLEHLRVSADEWRAVIEHFNALVRRIRSRSGDVMLIDLPLGDNARQRLDRLFPRRDYEDPLIRESHVIAIRSADVPELAAFRCPDNIHLDGRDGVAFTKALAAELRRRQFAR